MRTALAFEETSSARQPACEPAAREAVIDGEAAERELAELSSHLDAAMHRQLVLIRVIDESGLWHRQGAVSCAHWLSWRIGLDVGAARERIRVGRALEELPAIDEAFRRGRLSYSKVRAVTRVATPDNESTLLAMALESTASHLERICRGVRQQQAEDGNRAPLERWVRLRHRGEPTVRLEAELLPDEAERVMEALRVVRERMRSEVGDGEKPSLPDALVRAADEVLASREEARRGDAAAAPETRTSGADRADVLVYLGPDPLNETHAATLEDGAHVSAETLRRLACDCGLTGVARDEDGSILDIGRKTRRIPPALRRAVMARDRGCAFPGCTHDRFIDMHHAEHWFEGGETKLDNLLGLCVFHHRLLHEEGWRVALEGGSMPVFIRPDGSLLEPVCTPPPAPDDPLGAFERAQAELFIDEETGLTGWDGTRPDYDACIRAVCAAGDPCERPAPSPDVAGTTRWPSTVEPPASGARLEARAGVRMDPAGSGLLRS